MQRQPSHKIPYRQHNRAEDQGAFGAEQMVANVAADGNQAIYQRSECAKGDKGLFL